jgi:hypothetical protein
VVALGRLAAVEVDDFRGGGKTLACDFDMVFCAGKNGGGVGIDRAGLAMED